MPMKFSKRNNHLVEKMRVHELLPGYFEAIYQFSQIHRISRFEGQFSIDNIILGFSISFDLNFPYFEGFLYIGNSWSIVPRNRRIKWKNRQAGRNRIKENRLAVGRQSKQ